MFSRLSGVIQLLIQNLGNPADYRGISPVPMPDDALFPYITVQSIMEQEMFTHDGPSGLGPCIMQVNVMSKDYEEAENTRATIITLISTFQGMIDSRTIQGSNFMYAHETYDAEREVHILHSRFRMWFET